MQIARPSPRMVNRMSCDGDSEEQFLYLCRICCACLMKKGERKETDREELLVHLWVVPKVYITSVRQDHESFEDHCMRSLDRDCVGQ